MQTLNETKQHTNSNVPSGPEVIPSEKRKVGAKAYKIQIQLSQKARDRLYELVEKTESESAAQVVREALRVYDILIEETEERGNELMMRSAGSDDLVRLRLF